MAFKSLSEDQFKKILAENFTPSATIKTPERLFGRAKALKRIERALESQGRQIFIFGDRGVGKSSLALTAANLFNTSQQEPIYVVCGSTDSFANVMKSIGDAVTSVTERVETPKINPEVGASMLGLGATYKPGSPGSVSISPPESLNDALDIVRYVVEKTNKGRIIIVVDEMERIDNAKEREKFAELIKNLPELSDRVKFIFCGIANTVNELIGSHPSAGRILETIELEKLQHNYLWEIVESVAEKTNTIVSHEHLVRISQISDGFPHYVHLIGEDMFWSAFDDEEVVDKIADRHFKAGISGAIRRAESVLKSQYELATMKTRNTEDYQEALWALADSTTDQRQLTEMYRSSYIPIMFERPNRKALPKDKFNQRLLALKKDTHGRIVVGYGAGWFSFRENIVRGYVRLKAESENVKLGAKKANPLAD